MPQFSNSGRVVTVVAVSQGLVFAANAGDAGWTATVNATGANPPLSFSGIVFSAANNQKLYFADGVNRVYYEPLSNTCFPWVATSGTMPADSENNFHRLICTWRGRTVVSGLLLDPQNFFMSAIGDPNNWNYAPASFTPAQAVAGNNAPQGLIGDVVTSLCPYTDDILIFFGDHSTYMMRGDPAAGGQIDLVSDNIGGTWGICWAKDPVGVVYFMSNKMGVYTFTPGQEPQRISQAIEQSLLSIDTGANSVRLVWDDYFQGLHIFISPLAAPTLTTHFFYEKRTGAWWPEQFGNTNLDPLATCIFDGNTPGDRRVLIGSWDGYVRCTDPTATTDDGTSISSSVFIGPLLTKDLDEIIIKDLQAVLGEASGAVTFSAFVGVSAEAALAAGAVATGPWAASRNLLTPIRRAGHAFYLKLSSTSSWAMEQIRVRIATEGKVRRRGH